MLKKKKKNFEIVVWQNSKKKFFGKSYDLLKVIWSFECHMIFGKSYDLVCFPSWKYTQQTESHQACCTCNGRLVIVIRHVHSIVRKQVSQEMWRLILKNISVRFSGFTRSFYWILTYCFFIYENSFRKLVVCVIMIAYEGHVR